jgi:hypothetical protein
MGRKRSSPLRDERGRDDRTDSRSLRELIADSFVSTGCPLPATDELLDKWIDSPGLGNQDMYSICTEAESGNESGIKLCGNPTSCKVVSILPTAKMISEKRDENAEYELMENTEIFMPIFHSSETLEEAKTKCTNILECTGIQFSERTQKYEARGGEMLKSNAKFKSYKKLT